MQYYIGKVNYFSAAFFLVCCGICLGCSSHSEAALSFQNKWGVIYYVYPRLDEDGCRSRTPRPFKRPRLNTKTFKRHT